jgi:hypothetical protein
VPYPNLLILPQWHTEALLRERLAALGGTAEIGRELSGVHQDAQGVTTSLINQAAGTTERVRARFLVGLR